MDTVYIAYIGLLRADGTEPDKASGYQRISIAAPGEGCLPQLIQGKQIVFPDVTAPGYGKIASIAAYSRRDGGKPLHTWPLQEPVDVQPGVVPVIHNGKLWRGVDVKAKVTVKPSALCRSGGGSA